MMMTCYEDNDDVMIWVSNSPATTAMGKLTFVIKSQKIAGQDLWETTLSIVAPNSAGNKKTFTALAATGWDMGQEAADIDKQVAMEKFGARLVLWKRTSNDREADLEKARIHAAEYNENPETVFPFLEMSIGGRSGYDLLSG